MAASSALPPAQPVAPVPLTQIFGLGKTALGASLALALCLGAATFAPLRGAVIASGQILVEGRPQTVESLEPGVLAQLTVQNGDRVEAGQMLMRLDPTQPQANLDIAMDRLAMALAEEARLLAEAQGLAQPDFTPPALPFPAPDLSRAVARQKALFETRRSQQQEARRRLAETDAQLVAQIDGQTAQIQATTEEAQLLQLDLERQTGLVARGLGRQAQLSELQRQQAELKGRLASLAAETARLEASRREAALTQAQEESRRSEEVAQGLRDATLSVQEQMGTIVSLRGILAHSELRAPVTGIVHELSVAAPGSVIGAGTPLATIVPTERRLEIEVAVDPHNIDNLHEGQEAQVMISAFDPRVVPKLDAWVKRIPPDATQDTQRGTSFYRVTLELADGELPPGLELRPGMPVQAFISTGKHSLMSWLLAPLEKPFAAAMSES